MGMSGVLIVDDNAVVLMRTLQRSAMARGGYGFDALELKWSARIADELGVALRRRRTEGRECAFGLLGLRFGEPKECSVRRNCALFFWGRGIVNVNPCPTWWIAGECEPVCLQPGHRPFDSSGGDREKQVCDQAV